MPTATEERTRTAREAAGPDGAAPGLTADGGLGPPGPGEGGGGGPSGGEVPAEAGVRTALLGTWALVAAVTMLFVGFTSTYLVRRTGPGWVEGPMPPILYANTAALALSSVALEAARRAGREGRVAALTRRLGGAAALGALFLAGQATAWWQLMSRGLLPASGPHASFFYLLSGMHALHVAAGLVWLVLAWARSRRVLAYAEVRAAVESAAVFWHFIGVLWLYLWALLFWA